MRRSLLLALLLAPSCLQPGNNLGHTQLVTRYEARFEVRDDKLVVEVVNPGGSNIVALDAVVRDGALFVGGRRASSGPRERRILTLDVSPFALGPEWHRRVYWAEFNDEPATRLDLQRGSGSGPGRRVETPR